MSLHRPSVVLLVLLAGCALVRPRDEPASPTALEAGARAATRERALWDFAETCNATPDGRAERERYFSGTELPLQTPGPVRYDFAPGTTYFAFTTSACGKEAHYQAECKLDVCQVRGGLDLEWKGLRKATWELPPLYRVLPAEDGPELPMPGRPVEEIDVTCRLSEQAGRCTARCAEREPKPARSWVEFTGCWKVSHPAPAGVDLRALESYLVGAGAALPPAYEGQAFLSLVVDADTPNCAAAIAPRLGLPLDEFYQAVRRGGATGSEGEEEPGPVPPRFSGEVELLRQGGAWRSAPPRIGVQRLFIEHVEPERPDPYGPGRGGVEPRDIYSGLRWVGPTDCTGPGGPCPPREQYEWRLAALRYREEAKAAGPALVPSVLFDWAVAELASRNPAGSREAYRQWEIQRRAHPELESSHPLGENLQEGTWDALYPDIERGALWFENPCVGTADTR